MASGYASKHRLASTAAAEADPKFQNAMKHYKGALVREQRARDRGDKRALLKAKLDQLDMLLEMDMVSQDDYEHIIASPTFAS